MPIVWFLHKFVQFCTPTLSSGLCLIHYYHYQPSQLAACNFLREDASLKILTSQFSFNQTVVLDLDIKVSDWSLKKREDGVKKMVVSLMLEKLKCTKF